MGHSPKHHSERHHSESRGGSSKAQSTASTSPRTPKTDDWKGVMEPEERRRIQNRLAQRKFRNKARLSKEQAERDSRNQEHATGAYRIPTAADFPSGGNDDPSGLPWGGFNLRSVVGQESDADSEHRGYGHDRDQHSQHSQYEPYGGQYGGSGQSAQHGGQHGHQYHAQQNQFEQYDTYDYYDYDNDDDDDDRIYSSPTYAGVSTSYELPAGYGDGRQDSGSYNAENSPYHHSHGTGGSPGTGR